MKKLIILVLIACVGCGRNTQKQAPVDVQYAQTLYVHKTEDNENVESESEVCTDVYAKNKTHIKELEVANDSLMNLITSSFKGNIVSLLAEENKLTNLLIVAKRDFLKYHWNDGGEPHDYSQQGYFDLVIEMQTVQNANLQELLDAISTGKYEPKRQYQPVPKAQFATAYKDLNNNVCGMRHEYFDLNDFQGDSIKTRELLQKEKLVWDKLQSTRAKISQQLTGNQRKTFDNGSRRLQWHQLVQLKNEYKQYGLIGWETLYCCISDSCSYEILLNYPNYTTAWNDFCKRYYHSTAED